MSDWAITEKHKNEMHKFVLDLWQLMKNYYELPAEDQEDEYWEHLIKSSDALMRKYNDGYNSVVNKMVMGFLDGQSARATN